MPIIEIRDLRKVYRAEAKTPGEEVPEVRALDGINLTIERGDFVAIVGQSGSGKSTLMQILGLLDKKSSGQYFLDGEEITHLSDETLAGLRSTKIGFIFQFFNLLPRTTATDNVALPMLYAGEKNPAAKAHKLLRMVGLETRLNHRPHQLSGGQQQRVAIARALANDPQIIFADEPTGNISTEQSNEILNQLEELNRGGTTIILVTHETDVAQRANRIIVLRDGKVEKDERRRAIQSKPAQKNPKKIAENNAFFSAASRQRFKENLRMAVVALSLNKMRTALATLGIVIGIGSVVAMLAVGRGAQKQIEAQLSSLGSNILSVYPSAPKTGPNMASGRNLRKFSVEDYEALQRTVTKDSPIENVGALINGSALVSYGANNANTRIIGATASYEKMQNATLTVGHFFTDEDDKGRQRVALLGQTVVKNLFGDTTNPLGSIIKINRVEFRVVGVLTSKGANSFRDADDQIIVPLQTAMYRILGKRFVDNLTVSARNPQEVDAVSELVKSMVRERRKIQGGADDFDVFSLNEIRDAVNSSTKAISSLLAAIASISLLVGGIGIMNVMLVSVKERTREIGLRKALGARKHDVLLQFLVESVLICLLGGFIGLITGYLLSLIASAAFGLSAIIPFTAAIAAFFFSALVGIVFGLWPAKQASELSPIEALRYE